MSLQERAAQFAPFAALSGYGEAIDETVRQTMEQVELSEEEQAELNGKLTQLTHRLPTRVTLTCFEPDVHKAGGRYLTRTVWLKQIHAADRCLVLKGGEKIALDRLLDIEPEEP